MNILPLDNIGVVFSTILFIFLVYKLWSQYSTQKDNTPPQPSGAWPILGHLPLLGNKIHLSRTLANLSDKYGPIFTLRLGMQNAVIVSSREAVSESFTTNDKFFANRPKSNSQGEHLVYNYASFGFANGPYWREMRKIVTLEILSARRLELMKNLRMSEVGTSIKELYVGTKGKWPCKVNMSRWIDQVALNIIVSTIASKRYRNDIVGSGGENDAKEVESFRALMREFTYLSGEFVISDVIPIRVLKWMDVQGHIKSMKRVSKDLDGIIEKWIDEHVKSVRDEQDFLDVMISTIHDKFMDEAPPRLTIIKATVVNVILGGFDTTSVFLTWILSLLVNHKLVLKLAQQEIDENIGKQRIVQDSDLKNLPYLQAIIKETLRLYPPLPLSIPHEAVEDCRLSGYHIPKGTLLFVNLWKLHRDPKFWTEPDKFMPERFLTSHAQLDFMGKQFEYTPFGAGRRSCPGTTFAIQVTSLLVARLIQGFDMAAPENGTVDMDEGIGITMPRANPLEMIITPRLDSALYEN